MERPIPIEHDVARAAQNAVEGSLLPCICTRPAQGDDYGLDAYVQHVLPGRPPRITQWFFGLQIKGSTAPLDTNHQHRLQVAHLKEWTSANIPVLVAVHSIATNATRWRFAFDIIPELDKDRPQWRNQTTVSVTFDTSTEHNPTRLHDWIHSSLVRTSDTEGGKVRFHREYRRVLLTELYHDYVFGSQSGGIAAEPNGPPVGHFAIGMHWKQGEIDERAVSASRVLSGAMLLFEEAYFPAHLISAAVGSLGAPLFARLIEAGRIVPFFLPRRELAFVTGTGDIGDLYFLDVDLTQPFDRDLQNLKLNTA